MIRLLLIGCLLLLSACASQPPLPEKTPTLALPLQLHVQRMERGQSQDWLLVIQREGNAIRWSMMDPVELVQRAMLLDQMMEGLVAEQDVDAGIRHIEGGAVAADQLDGQALARGFFTAPFQAMGVGVQTDQARGREHLLQQLEGFPLAATGVEQYRRDGQRLAEQAAQVVDGHAQHMMLPGVAAQEPEAEPGFFDVVLT